MALELKLNQKLTQSLVMTPQLQQAIKLLQLGRLEYLEVIEKELLENPVLENVGEEEQAPPQLYDSQSNQVEVYSAPSENDIERSADLVDANVELMEDLSKNSLNENESSWTGILEEMDGTGQWNNQSARFADGELPSLESTVSNPEGLVSHVLWQLRTYDVQQKDQLIVVQIVGNLDRNGYLSCPLEEIAQAASCQVEDVERALRLVQELDPPGLGARDLKECLLIQLEQLGYEGSLAAKIVSSHLDKLETRRYDLIANIEKTTVEEIYQAVKIIQKLEPRPGRPFIDEAPIYITPDIYVRKVDDDYVISLNENGMPKLRLNQKYKDLLSTNNSAAGGDKEYLQDRIRSAAWLIKSIHQRQQTIYKVTESIVKFQRDFLDKGISELKPLVLRDVAADVGMHESTVSRVTTNKYVHTPHGLFELKFFFTSGLKSGNGEVSSESVKEKIRELVSSENPRRPLSDQAIVDAIKTSGIDIARRTVAKYREIINIPSSARRKKVF